MTPSPMTSPRGSLDQCSSFLRLELPLPGTPMCFNFAQCVTPQAETPCFTHCPFCFRYLGLITELDDLVSLCCILHLSLCKPQLWRESARAHNLLLLYSSCRDLHKVFPSSVFHSLDVAYAAWGSDERTVPHKCGSVSEETRIKVFGQLRSCVLWSCLCSCPVTGEPCGQAQMFPHLPTILSQRFY